MSCASGQNRYAEATTERELEAAHVERATTTRLSGYEPGVSDDELANRALDNLEKMHPQYLAGLLRSRELAKVIRQRADWYRRTMARLQKEFPNEPLETLGEKARDCLGGTNLNWRYEKPLTTAAKEMLSAFRMEQGL
jgi:hypothetical protein